MLYQMSSSASLGLGRVATMSMIWASKVCPWQKAKDASHPKITGKSGFHALTARANPAVSRIMGPVTREMAQSQMASFTSFGEHGLFCSRASNRRINNLDRITARDKKWSGHSQYRRGGLCFRAWQTKGKKTTIFLVIGRSPVFLPLNTYSMPARSLSKSCYLFGSLIFIRWQIRSRVPPQGDPCSLPLLEILVGNSKRRQRIGVLEVSCVGRVFEKTSQFVSLENSKGTGLRSFTAHAPTRN
jgi:hypothetical protein